MSGQQKITIEEARKLLPWPWNLTTAKGIDVEKECSKLLYSIECVKMVLLQTQDQKARDRLNRDIQHVDSKRIELLRLARADDLQDAETRRRHKAGRIKSVEAGKHKQRRPNAAGITVDAPQVREAYVAQRKAKSRNTRNAAAKVVSDLFGFTKGQVMREAERGAWFTV